MLAPQWSPSGDTIIFGIGTFNAFFNGFNGLFLKPADRVEGGAQVAMVRPDGSGFREVTSGANNNGFPSMARMASDSSIGPSARKATACGS